MAPDHQQQKFKKLTGTRAHEARVLPGFQRHLTHKLSNSQSHSQSFKLSQTLTLKVSEKKRKREKKKLSLSLSLTSAAEDSRRRQLLVSLAAVEAVEAFTLHSDPWYPFFSLSLSIGLPLIVSAENPNEPQLQEIIIRNPKFAC